MSLLLDTQVLLWAVAAAERLPADLCRRIADPARAPVFSAASLWEIAAQGDPALDGVRIRSACLGAGYAELPVTGRHVLDAAALAGTCPDPVARVLVAQARAEGMILVTADPAVAACGGRIELIDGAGAGGSYRPRPSTG